jgi:hypothetical protein
MTSRTNISTGRSLPVAQEKNMAAIPSQAQRGGENMIGVTVLTEESPNLRNGSQVLVKM